VLPLKRGSRVAVLGPMGMTREGLLSDYAAGQLCWNDYDWSVEEMFFLSFD
jgi:hypothetical protein